MFKILPALAATALLALPAQAQSTTDLLVDRLQGEGYTRIEIKQGLTQTKVEAIRGTEKLEFIYDNATGAILKEERERADADEIGRTGVEIDRRNRDFLDDDRDDDDDDRDDRDDRGRDRDDDRDDDDDDRDDDDDDDDDDDSDDDDDDGDDDSDDD